MPYKPFDNNQEYTELLHTLLQQLDKLPGPLKTEIEKDVQELITMVDESRYPRFVLVGRRGAGKTTLLNAIFGARVGDVGAVRAQTGATTWKTLEGSDNKCIEILDTRGFQEGNRPVEADEAATSEESVLQAIREVAPDAFLFLIKAKEVNAAIEGDLDALERFIEEVRQVHGFDPLIVGVVTQCDELDPPYVRTAHDRQAMPEEWQQKQRHIEQAVTDLRNHLEQRDIIRKNLKVVATAAFVRFQPDGTIDPNIDYRWGIDDLTDLLIEEMPEQAQLQFARLAQVRHHQRNIARAIVQKASLVCFTLGMQPVPMVDIPILATIQTFTVMTVAYIAGLAFSLRSIKGFLKEVGVDVVGAGYLFRQVGRGLVKLLPFAGEAISGAAAAAATRSTGEVAIAYFIDGVDISQARERGNSLLEQAYDLIKQQRARRG